jgi:hypothetical protein
MDATATEDPTRLAEIAAIECVVATLEHARPVALDGTPLTDRPEGSRMYVMAKEDGRWLLVACQNTLVVDG